MKKSSLFIFCFILTFCFAFQGVEKTTEPLALGAETPKTDLKMKDVSGIEISLDDIKKENGLLVIFSCNTCPFVLAWEDRYPGLAEICEKNNVGMVLVNSNEAKRNDDDSMAEMKKHASEKNYKCYYAVDENSVLADSFRAKATPHVFLFGKDLKLVYRGAIDDSWENEHMVTRVYLEDAIECTLDGIEVDYPEIPAVGCTVKWKSGNEPSM